MFTTNKGFERLKRILAERRRVESAELEEAVATLKEAEQLMSEISSVGSALDPDEHKLESRLRQIETDLELLAAALADMLAERAREENAEAQMPAPGDDPVKRARELGRRIGEIARRGRN